MPTMSKAERTSQFIIEKVAPVFNKKGYVGTSMSDLTEATGLTKGAIYGNFANKEAVALAAFNYNLSIIQTGLRQELSQTSSALEQLLVYPRYYARIFNQLNANGGCPILNGAVDMDDAPVSELALRAKSALREWRQRLVVLIEKGQQQGEIRPEAEPLRYATLLIALIEGGILQAHTLGEAEAVTTTLEYVEQLIERELRL